MLNFRGVVIKWLTWFTWKRFTSDRSRPNNSRAVLWFSPRVSPVRQRTAYDKEEQEDVLKEGAKKLKIQGDNGLKLLGNVSLNIYIYYICVYLFIFMYLCIHM